MTRRLIDADEREQICTLVDAFFLRKAELLSTLDLEETIKSGQCDLSSAVGIHAAGHIASGMLNTIVFPDETCERNEMAVQLLAGAIASSTQWAHYRTKQARSGQRDDTAEAEQSRTIKNKLKHRSKRRTLWEKLNVDTTFFAQTFEALKLRISPSRTAFDAEWAKATNRFARDLIKTYCHRDCSIDWIKLLRFNSGKR